FNATDFVTEKFKKINLRHQQLITRVFRKKDLTSPLNEFIGSAVMISLVWFGGKMIIEGTANITGETFLGFIIIFSQLLVPIQSIANNLTILNKAKVSMERINEVLNTDEKILDAENPISLTNFKSNIAYKNVSFKYNDIFVV